MTAQRIHQIAFTHDQAIVVARALKRLAAQKGRDGAIARHLLTHTVKRNLADEPTSEEPCNT